jgi:hypothetical protein
VSACLLLGVVGAAAVGEVYLLRARPRTPEGRRWRLLGLTTLSSAFVAGLLAGAAAVVVGLRHPATAFFAFLEGGLLGGAVGLVVGVCVSAGLAWALRRH